MIHLTPAAVEAIQRFVVNSAHPVFGLRLLISGGGCSGFQYGMRLETEKSEDDWELDVDGLKLLVDPMSYPLMDNVTIDFVESLARTGFQFDNPNAVSRCSCGQSFAA